MTTTASLSLDPSRAPRDDAAAHIAAVVAFYTDTDSDYGIWSRDYNMHFGYHEWSMNPLDRESMLHRMNAKVLERLMLRPGPARVADLGCGTGATARALLRARPESRVSAVTIVPAQIARGRVLNAMHGTDGAIEFVLRDYADTGLGANQYDGVYAIESACHAQGRDKRRLLEEAFRLLKPGSRLVIADCFVKNPRPLRGAIKWAYRRWCESWAVPDLPHLDQVREAMTGTGFEGVDFTDISWNVAASVAHAPYVATRFLVTEMIKARGKLSAWRRRHVAASLLSMVLGLCRASFGYYLVSARKPG